MPANAADVWKELKSKVNLVYYLGANRLKILEDSFKSPAPIVKKTLVKPKNAD